MTENFKTLFSKEGATNILINNFRDNNNGNKQNKIKELSHYGKKLKELKKISRFYGNLEKKHLQKIFYKCCNKPSKINENMFWFLESRLDVVLYRAGFFESIAGARQMVRIGGIQVNKKKVVSPNYIVIPGDIVSVFEKKDKEKLLKKLQSKQYFSFIAQNKNITVLPKAITSSLSQSSIKSKKSINDSYTHNFEDLLPLRNTIAENQKERTIDNYAFKTEHFVVKPCKAELLLKSAKSNSEILIKAEPLAKDNYVHGIKSSAFLPLPLPSTRPLAKQKEIRWRFKISSLFMSTITQNNGVALMNTVKKAVQSNRFLASLRVADSPEARNVIEEDKNATYKKKDKKLKPSSFSSFISFFNKSYIINSKFNSDQLSFLSSFEKEIFTFLNYLLYIKKNLQKKNYYFQNLAESKKNNTFSRSRLCKAKLYTRHQKFLSFSPEATRKSKAHHLEISYKSLSIIFLFPPQQIIFPHFINFSLIYK